MAAKRPLRRTATLAEPSVRRNSIARLVSDGSRLVVGLVAASITARWLGPAGKGTLSTLLYISVLLTYASSLGLADAAIVMKGKGVPLQRAISASVLPVMFAACGAVVVLWGVAIIAEWRPIYPAVAIASLLIISGSFLYLFIGFQDASQDMVLTSAVSVVRIVLEAIGLLIFIVAFGLDIFGGILAAFIAASIALGLLYRSLRSFGFSLRPHADWSYLRAALRFGAVNEGAFLLVALSERLDLLIVYALANEREAGIYAIALTIGGIVSYAPAALTNAAFPRMAHLPDADALALTARVTRLTVTVSLLGAVAGFLTIPFIIPLLFGPDFSPSVRPTLILLINAILWSAGWSLARATAAQGHSHVYIAAFGAHVATMVALDVLLIGRYGASGAAVGAVGGSTVGLVVCLAWYVRWSGIETLRTFVPTPRDVKDVLEFPQTILGLKNSKQGA